MVRRNSRAAALVLFLTLASCAAALLFVGCGPTVTGLAPNTWTELKPSGPVPSARAGHAMVYDADTDKVLLFGGCSVSISEGEVSPGEAYDDTWAYDPLANTWTELEPAGIGPSARAFASLVYVPSLKQMILLGGVDFDSEEGESLSDMWAYDPAANTWAELDPSGSAPPVRSQQAMTYDPVSDKVILFGGDGDGVSETTGNALNDTWAYDPVASTWTKLEPVDPQPPARQRHAMVCEPGEGTVVLFGGISSTMFIKQGTVSGTGIEPTSMDYLDVRPPVAYGDTWVYDPVANTWTELTPAGATPAARSCQSMVYDSHIGRVILFGGASSESTGDDTWSYDLAANAWTELKPAGVVPLARYFHAMVYASSCDRVILFGGMCRNGDSGEFWCSEDTWAYQPDSD